MNIYYAVVRPSRIYLSKRENGTGEIRFGLKNENEPKLLRKYTSLLR